MYSGVACVSMSLRTVSRSSFCSSVKAKSTSGRRDGGAGVFLDVRNDFFGEQLDVVHREIVRKRSELDRHQEVAEADLTLRVDELFAHRLRAAHDEHAGVGEILERAVDDHARL